MFLLKLNPIEPPWYGPVCPVVWEGRHREGSPYPDHGAKTVVSAPALRGKPDYHVEAGRRRVVSAPVLRLNFQPAEPLKGHRQPRGAKTLLFRTNPERPVA
jgi:hypothetical protein